MRGGKCDGLLGVLQRQQLEALHLGVYRRSSKDDLHARCPGQVLGELLRGARGEVRTGLCAAQMHAHLCADADGLFVPFVCAGRLDRSLCILRPLRCCILSLLAYHRALASRRPSVARHVCSGLVPVLEDKARVSARCWTQHASVPNGANACRVRPRRHQPTLLPVKHT